MRVWKYTLELVERQDILMPRDATVLHVDVQHRDISGHGGRIILWALVDTERVPYTERTFVIAGTGHELPAPVGAVHYTQIRERLAGTLGHLGTVLMGEFVWHVFEEF